MMAIVMLTTIDNPFNPFNEWDQWKSYDEHNKYFSCGLLDRIATASDELSDADYQLAIESAIDEILRYDPTCKYMKVYEPEVIVEQSENITDRGEGV